MTDEQARRRVELLEQAKSYNAAVVGVGYAGIFALLSYTHENMTVGERGLAGGCLLLSLAVFVTWVVLDMILRTVQISTPPWFRWLWMAVLALTIVPAMVAAGTMFRVYWRMLLT